LENFNKALDDYKNAINIDPLGPFVIHKYGALLIKLHLYGQAIAEFENLLEIYPNNKSVLLNLGICLQKKRNFSKASEIYNTLLQLDGNNLEALNNKAYIFQCLGMYDEAINLYKKIIKIDKHFSYALLNTAVIMLNKEEFLDGWKFYEYRTKCEDMFRLLKSSKPEVQSFNTSYKTIFIWTEQGIGDQIIYASLLLDAFKTKNKFYVSVDSRLISLFKRSFSQFDHVTFISADEKLIESKYDFHLPIGSLGKFFRNSIQDFDTHPIAYLKADQREVDSLKKKLKKEGHKVCGISWKSNNKEIGEAKTLSLTQLLPILSIPNTIFIDLQYGDNSEEKEKFLSEYGIEIKSINEIDNYNNLDGLTSLIDACDYVVTISNVTAHIAGALHKKTYLLLPCAFGKIWYWGQSRDYSLWYPSVKIYRNTKSHSWDETIDDLSKKIRSE
jgi:ADP-heptose:LPS heptosyltransferase